VKKVAYDPVHHGPHERWFSTGAANYPLQSRSELAGLQVAETKNSAVVLPWILPER
jgi:hypothetical protein